MNCFEDCKRLLQELFAEKDKILMEDVIMKLPGGQNGNYVVQKS